MKFTAIALAALVAMASADEFPACDQDKFELAAVGASGKDCFAKYEDTSNPTNGTTARPAAAMMTSVTARAATPQYTDAQHDVLCLYGACIAYINELKAAVPKECVIDPSDSSRLFYRDIINPLEDPCEAKGKTPSPNPGQNPGQKTPPPRPGCKDSA